MSLRKRLEQSRLLEAALSALLAGYLRLCYRTSRWQGLGLDQLLSDLKQGPVIIAGWHGRLMIAPLVLPRLPADIRSLRDPSPAGRLSAATQARFGMHAIEMPERASDIAAMRNVLRAIRQGASLGLTADGPAGPARKTKPAIIEWARASGAPVWMLGWSSRRAIRLGSWDRLMIPLPFSRGIYGFRRWPHKMPRRPDASAKAALQQDFTEALDAWTDELDRMAGRPPEA